MSIEENKTPNLDSFFDTKTDESPKNASPLRDDYENIYSNYNFNQEYQYVIEQSKLLQKTEHIEIFKIIDKNGDDYTTNENGVFIALNKLKPETLKQITQFIEFCLDNKSKLQEDINQRDAIREIMNCQTDEVRGFNKMFLINEKN